MRLAATSDGADQLIDLSGERISSTLNVYGSMKSVELVTWPSAPFSSFRFATIVVGYS